MTRNLYDQISELESERQRLILAAEDNNNKIKTLETRISGTEERLEEAKETERGLLRQLKESYNQEEMLYKQLRDARKSLREQEEENFKKESDLQHDLRETKRQLVDARDELGRRRSESVITPSRVDTTSLEDRPRRESRVEDLAPEKTENWAVKLMKKTLT